MTSPFGLLQLCLSAVGLRINRPDLDTPPIGLGATLRLGASLQTYPSSLCIWVAPSSTVPLLRQFEICKPRTYPRAGFPKRVPAKIRGEKT